MSERPPSSETHLARNIRWLWIALSLLAAATALARLDVNSLWLDELFTAYFADPANADMRAFLNRAAEDVHPPGYYLLVWAASRATGLDVGLAARGVSWVFAVLTLIALPRMMPLSANQAARLFAVVFAATSLVFFIYANEGRSYALGWFLIVLLLGISFQIRRRLRSGAVPVLPILALVILGVLAGLSHYYLITITGAVVGCLILSSRNWTQRSVLALAGLVILMPLVLFIRWHGTQVVGVPDQGWFSADAAFLVRQTVVGALRVMGSSNEQSLFLLLLAAGGVAGAVIWREGRGTGTTTAILTDSLFIVGVAVLGVGLTILVTLAYVPSYSFRFFLVLAPVYWMITGILFALILESRSRTLIVGSSLAATVVFCLMTLRVFWAFESYKQPWRETAATIAEMPACATAPLAVVTFDRPFISESEAARFYGYYLEPDDRAWLAVPRGQLPTLTEMPAFRRLVAERLADPDACPVLLWAVQHGDRDTLASLRDTIAARLTREEGTSVVLQIVATPRPGRMQRFLGLGLWDEGYLIAVERPDDS